jgi:hypothetical protein
MWGLLRWLGGIFAGRDAQDGRYRLGCVVLLYLLEQIAIVFQQARHDAEQGGGVFCRMTTPATFAATVTMPVRDVIDKLSTQARRELIALMQIGRGDGVGWVSIFPHLVKRAEPPHAADYVVGKGRLLADYLGDGLRKLGLA